MSEHLLSYNERQNFKLAQAWYERIDETVQSTRPVGETNYDEECLNSVNFYWQMVDVMLQELMLTAEDAKKLDPRLQMYSVRKVHDECVEYLKALRTEIDDWLDENTEPVPQQTIKELLAKYTPEELQQILREELATVGVDPDDANAVQEILQPINWNAASVTS